jgi:hypothetical protein
MPAGFMQDTLLLVEDPTRFVFASNSMLFPE